MDAVQSSKFITAKKSNELIKKLEGFASMHEAKDLHRQVYVHGRIKTMNESIYYNVDKIHQAIGTNVQIRFQYFQWNVKKEMELRHDGAFYQISPWQLMWDDEHFSVNVDVAVSGQFIGWLVALGDGVKAVGPESVVERMKEEGKRICKMYNS